MLFTSSSNNNYFGHAAVVAAPLDTGVPKVLVENAYFGRYLPGGYLAYLSHGTLFVAPFDVKKLQVTGTAIPAIQTLNFDLSNGGVQFSAANNGMAIYLLGSTANNALNIAMLDRAGEATTILKDKPDAASPRLSPDGKRLAFENGSGGIWVHDLERGTTSPVTPKSVGTNFPIWTPDGERLAYSHPVSTARASGQRIYWRRADGTGDEEALTPEIIQSAYPSSWSPDGKILAFEMISEKDGSCCDIWTLSFNANGKPEAPKMFLASVNGGDGRSLVAPEFSPDGLWLAYVSTEAGVPQVNVVPYPGPGGKWQVSTNGGMEARWSKKGHELFYVHGFQMMAVPYTVEKNTFQPGKPKLLFENRFEMRSPYTSYDVTPDGQHFVVLQSSGGRLVQHSEPTVVLNWLDEVKREVAAGQTGAAK